MTLLEAITKHNLTPRARTKLLVQALEGLATLHAARLDPSRLHAAQHPRRRGRERRLRVRLRSRDVARRLGNQTYRTYYKGRIFGSPGWSVAPETIDQALMDSPINTSLDIYAIGGALHGLFTDQLLYGPADDMWALLIRIAEGVVVGGKSKVFYPDGFPMVLRARDRGLPRARSGASGSRRSQAVVAGAARHAARAARRAPREPQGASRRRSSKTQDQRARSSPATRIRRSPARSSRPPSARSTTWGYAVERSLGRVRGHPIFLAAPRAGPGRERPVPRRQHLPQARHRDRSDQGRRSAPVRRELAAVLLADPEARAPGPADVAAQGHLRRQHVARCCCSASTSTSRGSAIGSPSSISTSTARSRSASS